MMFPYEDEEPTHVPEPAPEPLWDTCRVCGSHDVSRLRTPLGIENVCEDCGHTTVTLPEVRRG